MVQIKICGLTTVEDARMCAKAGANFIGIIFAKKSKRFVDVAVAKDIASTVKKLGAQPVGVFVEQESERIKEICGETEIGIAQLHGNVARQAYKSIAKDIKTIMVASVDADGYYQNPEVLSTVNSADILLCDAQTPGGGICFNWQKFQTPQHEKWFLAGGLNAENVGDAIRVLRPFGVDVASGTAKSDGCRKDRDKVYRFIEAVHRSFSDDF